MRMLIKYIFLLFVLFPAWLPLYASPYLKIKSIDTATEFPKIDINVDVRGKNKNVLQDLNEDSFLVYEDGTRINNLQVTSLNDTQKQIHIILCIDSSRSITPAFLNEIKKSAVDMLSAGNLSSQIALYRFNDNVVLLNDFTDNIQSLSNSINDIERHGSNTLLYNAIYDAIQLLDDVQAENRAIVVFTDGIDEGSSVNVRDILAFAKETGTSIFFMSFKASPKSSQLDRIAKLTGGHIIHGGQQYGPEKMYKDIFSSIQSRYVIRYQSSLKQDNKDHKIEVRLIHNNLRDRDSEDFFLKKKPFSWRFIYDFEILALALLGLLAVLLIIILFVLLKKKKYYKKLLKMKKETNKSSYREPEVAPVTLSGLSALPDCSEGENNENTGNPHYSNAWLIKKDGEDAGKKIVLYNNETILGKKEGNGIIICDNTVSPRHAKIKNVCGIFYLFDLISANGTYLNGSKLLRPKPLYDWDEINIGRTCFIFRGSKIIG